MLSRPTSALPMLALALASFGVAGVVSARRDPPAPRPEPPDVQESWHASVASAEGLRAAVDHVETKLLAADKRERKRLARVRRRVGTEPEPAGERLRRSRRVRVPAGRGGEVDVHITCSTTKPRSTVSPTKPNT